jgi:CheY-like chemotaxis protein
MPKTILITDDQKHILKVLEFNLANTGCCVETANSGEEALAKAGRKRIDLLLIDVNLPGISGFDTIRAIRQQPAYAKLPVIVLTGGGLDECNATAARRAGTSVFLTKPFSPMELTRHVKELLAL